MIVWKNIYHTRLSTRSSIYVIISSGYQPIILCFYCNLISEITLLVKIILFFFRKSSDAAARGATPAASEPSRVPTNAASPCYCAGPAAIRRQECPVSSHHRTGVEDHSANAETYIYPAEDYSIKKGNIGVRCRYNEQPWKQTSVHRICPLAPNRSTSYSIELQRQYINWSRS